MPIKAIRDVNAPERVEVSIDYIDGTREVDGQLYEVVRVQPQELGFAPDMHQRIEGLGLTRLGAGYDNRWTEYGRPAPEAVRRAEEGHAPEQGGTSAGRFAPTTAQPPVLAETAIADSAALAAALDQPTSRATEPTASSPDGSRAAVTVAHPEPAPETGVPAGAAATEPTPRPGRPGPGEAGGETIAQLQTRAAGVQDGAEVDRMLEQERAREGGERKGAVEALERRRAELGGE